MTAGVIPSRVLAMSAKVTIPDCPLRRRVPASDAAAPDCPHLSLAREICAANT